jgi:uncharacterized membrane protein YccF (DUF307 family)
MGIFNVVWFVFVGWWSALITMILAGAMAMTIIGIPIAKSMFQLAKLNAFPFGKEIIRETELKGKSNVSTARKVGGIIANIIWFPFGICLAVLNLIAGIFAFCTIIGIPFGVVYVRMAAFVVFPIGAKVVTKKQAFASAVVNEMGRRLA